MDAVVYPKEEVINFITKETIPLRIPSSNEEMTKRFNIKWTPTLITMDANEVEHHRTLGFLSAEDIIPSILLGKAKMYLNQEKFPLALEILQNIINNYPKSNDVPEALFLRGVAGYKNTHQVEPLKEAYNILSKDYPETTWAKRAYPYSLL